jgi:hypothetical protein
MRWSPSIPERDRLQPEEERRYEEDPDDLRYEDEREREEQEK